MKSLKRIHSVATPGHAKLWYGILNWETLSIHVDFVKYNDTEITKCINNAYSLACGIYYKIKRTVDKPDTGWKVEKEI